MFLRGFRYTHQLGKNIFLVVRSHPVDIKKYSLKKTAQPRGFFDARKPGFQKCENVDVSKRKIETNPRNKKKAIAILKSEIAI